MGLVEIEEDELSPLTETTVSSICAAILKKLPKIQKATITREEIACQCNHQVPDEFRERYINNPVQLSGSHQH
jgi:hypothetical protein